MNNTEKTMDMIVSLAKEHKLLVTLEENVLSGGMGEHISSFVNGENLEIKVHIIAIPDVYVEHGNVEQLKKDIGIDEMSVYETVYGLYQKMNE